MRLLAFGNVRAQVQRRSQLDRLAVMITLVGRHLFDRRFAAGALQILLRLHHAVDQRVDVR